ncbi:STAS domain-containing protein [Streptomyces sp. NPDC059991]|uniref:STAS domain-containing protein n=1 Tax=unclassified Streptomyces TaxID=2593676 RepID=UPI0036C4C1D0
MLQDTPTPFIRHLRTYRIQGHAVLELRGDIDLATAIEITPQLDTATTAPELLAVIDLTPVTFIDCSGLTLLCRVHQRVTARHGNLQLVCPHPQTLRLLRMARLTDTFHPVLTLDEALHYRPHRRAGQRATEQQEITQDPSQGNPDKAACPETLPPRMPPGPQETEHRPAA